MYSLGSVTLDSGKQVLFVDGRAVSLQRKPYLILEYLIENRHRMVHRKELLDRFWDGKEVYDQSLSKAVGSVRKAFGETRSSSEFIETRWGLGYRYVGPFGSAGSPEEIEQAALPIPSPAGPHHAFGPEAPDSALSETNQQPVHSASTNRLWAWPLSRWGSFAMLGALLAVPVLFSAVLRAYHADHNQHGTVTAASTPPTRPVAVITSPPEASPAQASPALSNASSQVASTAALSPAATGTSSAEAYRQYRKAQFFAGSRTRDSFEKAIGLLKDAVRIDPKFAKAYAELADCYQLEGFYQFVPASVASPAAEAAAKKALSLDNSIAEAHIALLSSLTDYDWDWPGAEHEFKEAIAIDPNSAVAYEYYGYALLGMGRGDEALRSIKHAADLDPVSPSVQNSLSWVYYLLKQDSLAAEQAKRTLELHPDFVPAHQMLGIIYGQMGLQDRSLAELNEAKRLEPDSSVTPLLLDAELAGSGQQAEAAKRLRSSLATGLGHSVPDYYIAVAWSAVGDTERAKASLERGLQSRSNWMIFLQYDPRFDALRSDAQFQAVLGQVRSAGIALAER